LIGVKTWNMPDKDNPVWKKGVWRRGTYKNAQYHID